MGIRNGRAPRLAVLTSFLLALSCAPRDSVPGSGSIDGLLLGLELGLDLAELAAAEPAPGPGLLEQAGSLSHADAIDSARVYVAQTRLGDETVPLRIAVVPVDGIARLAVAVDGEGLVRASALWGAPPFDGDPDGAWETFRLQFHDRPHILHPSRSLDPNAVARYWRVLGEDPTPEAAVARALYRHKRLMAANSYYKRSTLRRVARGEMPPEEWFERWKENFREVSALSGALETVAGKETADRHRALADEAVSHVDAIRAFAESREAGDVLRFVSGDFHQATCHACHTLKSPLFEGEGLFVGVRSRLTELGVRPDICHVDMDLWAAPGQEALSQRVADAFKAAFVLLGPGTLG